MKIKSLGVSVILLSLIFTQDVLSQVVFDDTVNGYSVIDCSGMPKGAVKTADELAASKQSVADGGRVLRHQHDTQKGRYITGTYGTTALYINQKVSRKFAVAKKDVGAPTNWATASGWALSANSENTGNSDPAATGCAVYQAENETDQVGSWRLPTQRELIVIYSLKDQLAKTTGFRAFKDYDYISATQVDANSHWIVELYAGYVNTSYNIWPYEARCIKDL